MSSRCLALVAFTALVVTMCSISAQVGRTTTILKAQATPCRCERRASHIGRELTSAKYCLDISLEFRWEKIEA